MESTKTVQELMAEHKNWAFVRTDRNGTHYFHNYTCQRCGGRGVIDCYRYIDGGVCFECGGSGRSDRPEVIKVYTPEHAAKLAKAREERAAKAAAERQARLIADYDERMQKQGFIKEGDEWAVYRVIGETFSIKDELKSKGFHYNPQLGWYGAHPEGYRCQRLTAAQVLEDTYPLIEWRAADAVKELWETIKDGGEWVGEIGDKFQVSLTIHKAIAGAGYMGKTSFLYLMDDENGNHYKWSTSCWYEEGETYKLKVTVKDHTTYVTKDGVELKQTVLTRCTKVKE